MAKLNDNQRIQAGIVNISAPIPIGSLSASDQKRIFVTPAISYFPDNMQLKIKEVLLTSETSDPIDGTNYWSFNVKDVTNSVDLLSADVTNFTGGTAITADTPYRLTPDQNNTLGANTVIELDVTKAASATQLDECSVTVVTEWVEING